MNTIPDHRSGGRLALALAFTAAVIEGFDLQAAGVAAPKLGPAFGLTPQQIGVFFSAATFGLIFGALIGGRIADAWGRRAGLVLSLVLFGLFSLATAYVNSFETLIAARFLTGVGLGGALPNLVNIAAESAAPGQRGRAVSIMYAGVPLGGAIASLVAMTGVEDGGWRQIFIVGGIMPLLLAPFVQKLLPPLAVAKTAAAGGAAGALGRIFAPSSLLTTVLLWTSFFLGLLVVYLLLNWMPQLLVARGFTRSDASLAQIMFNVGGVVGCLLGGRVLDRSRPLPSVALCFGIMAGSLALLGVLPANLALTLLGGALVGGATLCVQAILYGVAPQCYPAEIRGTGVGMAVAVGRLGSIAGPLFAGILVARGFGPSQVMFSLVPIALLTGLATLILLARRGRAAQTAPQTAEGAA